MPPFIEMGLGSDIQEKECAPPGKYDLVAASVELKEYDAESDDGEVFKGQRLEIRHEIEGTDDYKTVIHSLFLPSEYDPKDKAYNKRLSIKRYLTAAGVPFDENGFDPEDIRGARFTCELRIEVDESGKYPDKNELRLPSLAKS